MATAIVDNWTELNCIKLIREFKARPMMWDPKDPFYYKKTMKPQLWEEIGKKLDMPALDCKHKMNILMSSFRREKAKIMHRIGDSNGDTSNLCMSTWFAFKEMMFLMDKETERKRRNAQMGSDNLDDEIDDNNDSVSKLKKTLLKHHVQPPISNSKRPRLDGLILEMAQKSMSTSATTTPPRTQPAQAQQAATSSTESDDEIKSFSNFISFKMKKYSETTKNAVQQAICDIIFKADQNFYENNDKFVIVDDRDQFSDNLVIEEDDNVNKEIKDEYDVDCFIEDDSE